MLRSDLCDYSDAYIVVEVTIANTNPANEAYDKKLALKNKAPFISCISKISNTLILVMPMYNLLKIIEKQQEPNGITIEMNQIVVWEVIITTQVIQLKIQYLLIIKLVLQENWKVTI